LNATVLDDGLSGYGLRRLHVLRGGLPVDEVEIKQMIDGEGGVLTDVLRWDDDLGNHHVYATWRYRMYRYPMWASRVELDKGLDEAVYRAVMNYEMRFEAKPNQGVVRVETVGKLRPYDWIKRRAVRIKYPGEKGENDFEILIKFVENGLQTGVVAVFREPEMEAVDVSIGRETVEV